MENPKFEYKVLKVYYTDEKYTIEKMNELGKEGWEFVAIRKDDYFIFKRRLKSDYELQNDGQEG